jgi:uncharacterized membrane protein
MSLLQLGCLVLGLGVVAASFPAEFWPKLRQERVYQHLVFASLAAISVLWSIQAGIKDGLQLHFLLLTTLVLCHGYRIALWLGLVPLLALLLQGKLAWQDSGIFLLSQLILPVLCSYTLFLWSYHRLSRQLFIYIFVAGFIGAALAIVLQLCATAGLLWLDGRYDWDTIYDNYLLFSLLIWFPEALLNGAALTLLAVYKPEWLRTFYDREYLSPER